MLTVRNDFVDRTAELDQLNSALHSEGIDKNSLVLMYGQRGIGKTQLLARFLRICRYNNIRIVYLDLPQKDYLGIIDKVEEELGPKGFQSLEQAYDDLLQRAQKSRDQAIREGGAGQAASASEADAAGFTFAGPVSAETQNFINGSVTYNNPKITNIFNFEMSEPRSVKQLNQKKITGAFYDCLRSVSQEQTIAILLDHWEEANDQLKVWLKAHLLTWASELALKKALIVMCQETLPEELKNQTGILPLALPGFTREIALEYWRKNELDESDFNELNEEVFGIPRILAIEVDRYKQLKKVDK